MNKRQECALKTRQRLLDTATDLISKGDFRSLNIEDITKACGCAKGTFYTYFKNREQISCEACRNMFNRIEKRMQQMKNKTFLERLGHYFDSFMVEVQRYGINVCREWIRGVIDPSLSPENTDITKWQFDVDMLQNILNQAIKDGELKTTAPVELLTHIIISELYGMMTCWCMSDGKFKPTDWSDKVFKAQLIPMIGQYLTKIGKQ
ncbi:MAG: TetR/AcrR family transcriptional regulator [Alphaproteobacteria bacterium]|nr:TetR/AcrR family transcriptional regulator [Alphaproteobacteria bacterium]